MAGKIFISYRRDDSAAHALNVAQYLESEFGKSNIFIDIDRLRAGQRFPVVLEDKLGQCKVMLAVIGPGWLDARDEMTRIRRLNNPEDWVRLEVERALARGIPLIPVLVGGASLPPRESLPPSLQPLVEHQYSTVTTNGFRHEMSGLARDVRDLLGRRPLRSLVAVSVLAALVLAIAGAYMLGMPAWAPGRTATHDADAPTTSDQELKARAEEVERLRAAAAMAEGDRRRIEAETQRLRDEPKARLRVDETFKNSLGHDCKRVISSVTVKGEVKEEEQVYCFDEAGRPYSVN